MEIFRNGYFPLSNYIVTHLMKCLDFVVAQTFLVDIKRKVRNKIKFYSYMWTSNEVEK